MVTFVDFDATFLECSWKWLNDPEIKRLTMIPAITRAEQKGWFRSLPRPDYLIWGVAYHGQPVGATGLKNLAESDAEYWGYIGEREFWGRGIGRQMMEFQLEQAAKRRLKSVFLKVHNDNVRAVNLYQATGFSVTARDGDVLVMTRSVC